MIWWILFGLFLGFPLGLFLGAVLAWRSMERAQRAFKEELEEYASPPTGKSGKVITVDFTRLVGTQDRR